MTSIIANILFDNKEHIPDGLYLKLMNTLKIINDNGDIPLTLEPVDLTPNLQSLSNWLATQFGRFETGIFKCELQENLFFEITRVTNCFLEIYQVNDSYGIKTGLVCNSKFKMNKHRTKIYKDIHNFEFIKFKNGVELRFIDLLPI